METRRSLLDGSSSTELGWRPNPPCMLKGLFEPDHTAITRSEVRRAWCSSVLNRRKHIRFNARIRHARLANAGRKPRGSTRSKIIPTGRSRWLPFSPLSLSV